MDSLDVIAVQSIITSVGSSMMELVGKISNPETKLPYSTSGELNISNEREIVAYSITAYTIQSEKLSMLESETSTHLSCDCPEAKITLQITYQGKLSDDERLLLHELLGSASDALVAIGGYDIWDDINVPQLN